MLKVFNLPDLGEGLTESEVLAWKVAEGETVALNQVIADVETAKAVVEIPSPYAGTVAKIYAEPGTVVEVGKPIIAIEVEGAAPAGKDAPSGGANASTTPIREPNLVGYGAAVETGARPTRRRRTAVPAAGAQAPSGAAPAAVAEPAADQSADQPARPAERPRSTPPVRKLARDLGIDLERLVGSGPDGLITRDDVRAAGSAASAPEAEPATAVAAPGQERVRISGVQKAMAAAMVDSAFTAPHATEFLTVDVTESMELLERLRRSREFEGLKLTPLTLVAKAACLWLGRTPELNSMWDGAAGEIVRFADVNLGIAAATPRGLLVPNIKAANRMDLAELARQMRGLVERARDGKTSPQELAAGTFSITNIGVFGIDAGTPIINPGEAGILAMGQVRSQPWEYRGEVALRQVMTLSLSFDHRLVDGAQASRFLAGIAGILRDPASLITLV
ncbi:dihydrolipoamide acetyltransferase family protein [Zhihengliuella halotolerans]|uniref:Dihydrolipoamide acetyltransferase component of pyruvate dehydrogenase complex n=1 Tax=Zhihengliuella halotolerans TaxID=370736 RepID=A0A4Q8ADT5_9MICC|nr:dihydrolipoamide acetyltransferase family protein [Zhihengliuella halotolerans]RZU61941.1 pyruvate dehydrogenase E2 component (dihydrolipoamide acetyltransferase) [Zhihengliuella halotolerans]